MNRPIGRWMDGLINGWVAGLLGGWSERWMMIKHMGMVRLIDRLVGGQMDGLT